MAHNAVFDIGWLQENGFKLRGSINCTMLASKLLYNGKPGLKHGLADVLKRELNIFISKEQQTSNWGADKLSAEQLEYAAKDVQMLLEVDYVLSQKIVRDGLAKAYSLECRALQAMALMWRTGLPSRLSII